MKRHVYIFGVLMIFALVLTSISQASEEKPRLIKLKVGDTIPDFTLRDKMTNEEVSFDRDIKGKGKVIAISFYTLACSACRVEFSLLMDLVNKYGDDIKVYVVDVDIEGVVYSPLYDMNPYSDKNVVKVLVDSDFRIPQWFGFTYTPSLVIADGDGKILFLKGGYSSSTDPDEIIKVVQDALKEQGVK